MMKVANAKVKAWRRVTGKEQGKDAALQPMLGATWGDETFEIPYGKVDASAMTRLSEWEPDWVSKGPTPSKEPREPECLERDPCPSGVAPGRFCVERGLLQRMAATKLGRDATMELLSDVLGAGDE